MSSKMRTRLRACARGKDYLPKEARSEPNAYARSLEDIRVYKEAFRRRPFGTTRLISPAVVFPRHTETLMSTNPSPTPPTSSQEPTPDFLSGPNDVRPTGSDRFSESSEVYGKIISSLKNLDDEEKVPQCPYPSLSKFFMNPEMKTDAAPDETSCGKSYEEKSQQTIPKIKLQKASTSNETKHGIKRKSIVKSLKRKSLITNKPKLLSKSAHKILKVRVTSTDTGAQIVEASTSALPVTPSKPPDNDEIPDEPSVEEKPVTEEEEEVKTKDEIPGTSSHVEQQVDYDYYDLEDRIQIQPYEMEAKSESESVGNAEENEPSVEPPEVISDPLEPTESQEEPMNQEADAYSDISTEEMPMEEGGLQESAEFSQFGDVNSTSDGGVTDSQIEELQTLEDNEAVASTSQASPNYEPMDSRQGMALQRPAAYVLPSTSRENSNSPVLLTNEDNWQQQATAVIIRDKMILEHQKQQKLKTNLRHSKFRAHKVYLAKSSVVFEHLLYGRSASNEYYYHDISSESFASLLQFIYEGELHLSSLKEACNMLEMAKRFRLDYTVISRCRSYIFVRIFPSSAWEVVTFAYEKQEPELFETAVKACRKLLDEEDVLTASRDLLLAMFTNDALHDGVDAELSLYKACTKWANHQMTANNASEEEIKNLIAPLLYQIRFVNMSLTDCIQVCDLRPNILSDAEKLSLMCFLANPQERAMPEFVSPKYQDDTDVNTTFFVYAMPHLDLNYALQLDINTYNQFSTSAFHINGESDDKTVNIIQIATQRKCDNPNDFYTEDLTLSFKDNTRPGVMYTERYSHDVLYDSFANIELKTPIPLKDIPSKIIEVRIIFHTTGRYPTTKDLEQNSINQIRENDPREMFYYNSGSNFMHLMGYKA
ncbi:hypothetical protein B566_EDAN015079 [Ephemera danica]|nr:hypothetical protein B566_EDAN015079 [Ephemera danica]